MVSLSLSVSLPPHGVVQHHPLHLCQGHFPYGPVLRRAHKLLIEIHGAQSVAVILLNDLSDAGNIRIERQIVIPAVTGHALVEHDVRHFLEFFHGRHLLQGLFP